MSRNLIVLFLLVAVICATVTSSPPKEECKPPTTRPPPPKCRKNEIFKECGTACQPSCKNRNPICKKLCVQGCFCKPGLLRNSRGKCVEPCDC